MEKMSKLEDETKLRGIELRDFQGKREQIFKIVPVDATIYVEKWTIAVSNLWQIDSRESGCRPSSCLCV